MQSVDPRQSVTGCFFLLSLYYLHGGIGFNGCMILLVKWSRFLNTRNPFP